jgi:NAD(P)H-flavin reductase
LLVAGGVGGTYTWPIAEYLTEKGKGFKMVWTVRSAGMSCFIRPLRGSYMRRIDKEIIR